MIRIRDLAVDLGGRPVLRGVDLDVARGEAVALVGPNGAGKTTVLRAVVRLVRHRGTIEVGGALGYMPQVPAFLEETARGALCFVAALRGAMAGEVDPLLARVGLLAHARRPVASFSAGMKQRLSLAAALIGDPEILVLDEPTASLDLRGQREFIEMLRALEDEGKTVLMTSHREEEVRALADRVVVLDEGLVTAEMKVEAVS
jgi:ABC-type multidrug transport system ATPase subunit